MILGNGLTTIRTRVVFYHTNFIQFHSHVLSAVRRYYFYSFVSSTYHDAALTTVTPTYRSPTSHSLNHTDTYPRTLTLFNTMCVVIVVVVVVVVAVHSKKNGSVYYPPLPFSDAGGAAYPLKFGTLYGDLCDKRNDKDNEAGFLECFEHHSRVTSSCPEYLEIGHGGHGRSTLLHQGTFISWMSRVELSRII